MRITLLLCFLLVFNLSYGQLTDEQRQQNLKKITETERKKNEERKKRVESYAKENEIETFFTRENNRNVLLYDIDYKGRPQYITTYNAEAAITSGAAFLASEEDFGMRLSGQGVRIGVWDGGLIRSTHVELVGRVNQLDGFTIISDHANHVTGTILASGVNERAKGMAPKATAINYQFNADIETMSNEAKPDDSGIILSNHSYGAISGWHEGSWRGDPSISTEEDYEFGFYNEDAASIDNIARNSPYYLIVWAAGNDRGDNGSGPYPPDGPYDIIPFNGNAKNIITVGAVNKIQTGYDSPEDVVMSSFSSWGPSDDGRIKPDLVGAGVRLVSSVGSGDNAYGSLSGTSMAAPNVTGTLALLQELNKSLTQSFLKSSELKGLAIHTAHEAGTSIGPDYSFGWGLMNGKGAGKFLLERNNHNKLLDSYSVSNTETYTRSFKPVAGTKVTATICWTDLPGTPVAPQLDPQDLMLVNDLDMRISNSSEEYFPYILDPANPELPATTGDNFRDNVEKIEFTASGEEYNLTVSPKGNISGGNQEFSLILSFESEEQTNYYWIGGIAGEWNNPENWSSSTGGESINSIPSSTNRVIFDSNSFGIENGASQEVNDEVIFTLSDDIEVGSFFGLSSQNIRFNLNGNDLIINEKLVSTIGNFKFTGDGNIILKNANGLSGGIDGSIDSFKDANIVFDTEDDFIEINSDLNFKTLVVRSGKLDVTDSKISIDRLIVEEKGELNASNSIFSVNQLSAEQSAKIEFNSSQILFGEASILDVNGISIGSRIEMSSSNLTVKSDAQVSEIKINPGSNLSLEDGVKLNIENVISATGSEAFKIGINSSGIADIIASNNILICLDYLNISGVNISGAGAFNAGLNSAIENATGWQSVACEDIVFSDFSNKAVCEGGVELFTNTSNGSGLSFKWYLNDELISENENIYISFPELQTYTVSLEVTDENSISDSYIADIEVVKNNLRENTVALGGSQLFSENIEDNYQWFKDGEPIEGATGRSINVDGQTGTFFVVTSDETCSRKSPEFEFRVTSSEEDLFDSEYNLYPNPANEVLNIDLQSAYSGVVEINMLDLSGRKVYSKSYNKNGFQFNETINTTNLSNGLYVIRISQGQSETSKLVAIEK